MVKSRLWILFVFLALAFDAYPQEAAETPAAALTRKLCGTCHTLQTAVSPRRTVDQWGTMIDSMVGKGLQASDADLDTVFDYLIRHHGLVNVNTAPADEIAYVLNISDDQAERIVKYRDEHGQFADFDALAKVPGLDAQQLEKTRSAVSF